MNNVKPEMVLFDVGGTLFKDGKFNAEAGLEKLRLSSVNPNVTTAKELVYYWDEFLSRLSDFEKSFEISLSSVLKYVTMNTGLKFDVSVHEQEEIFDRYNSDRTVIAGVKDLLFTLDKLGIRKAVISNNMMSGESLVLSLKHWIPEVDFEFCLTSADLLFKKPDKSLFETAIKYANLKPDECMYCGDGFIPDVTGSLNCGMKSVLYDEKSNIGFEFKKHDDKDYIVINDYVNLKNYFLKSV